ncbi:hypothetical protein Zmor_007297 [Zophobas morio]|uniref:Uncharacterized protein n=1 Tax=Zophobas morio TaxID=2755281 RepID=A0AA38IRU7_9CUCU|nr:hypothetical protein Zmor_007297 [Zophobas morio]
MVCVLKEDLKKSFRFLVVLFKRLKNPRVSYLEKFWGALNCTRNVSSSRTFDQTTVKTNISVHNRLLIIIEDSKVKADSIMSDCSEQTNTNTEENSEDMTDDSNSSNINPGNEAGSKQPTRNRVKRQIFDTENRPNAGLDGAEKEEFK